MSSWICVVIRKCILWGEVEIEIIYLLIQSVVVQRSQIYSFPYTINLIVHRILKLSEIQLSKLSSTTECYRSEHLKDYRTLIHIVSRKVFALRRNIVYRFEIVLHWTNKVSQSEIPSLSTCSLTVLTNRVPVQHCQACVHYLRTEFIISHFDKRRQAPHRFDCTSREHCRNARGLRASVLLVFWKQITLTAKRQNGKYLSLKHKPRCKHKQ